MITLSGFHCIGNRGEKFCLPFRGNSNNASQSRKERLTNGHVNFVMEVKKSCSKRQNWALKEDTYRNLFHSQSQNNSLKTAVSENKMSHGRGGRAVRKAAKDITYFFVWSYIPTIMNTF